MMMMRRMMINRPLKGDHLGAKRLNPIDPLRAHERRQVMCVRAAESPETSPPTPRRLSLTWPTPTRQTAAAAPAAETAAAAAPPRRLRVMSRVYKSPAV
ncbi:hypothetical protein EYF80_008653 [Liparis tanakae]|uniref:Uncharacterized protein n=1 Tax=Liparis tanakae TaxID=230148 RepID=A0A4Z2ITB5_9TELE|nr:hypothetical protein EYF80_008653 [Liparis tanakae]